MLGVSRMTANRALRELTQEGLLDRVHGLGTFVAEKPGHASLVELRDIADDIREAGKTHTCENLRLDRQRAGEQVAARMEIAPGTDVFHLEALHRCDQVPVQLEHRYVNPRSVPDFMSIDLAQTTATRFLMARISPEEMEHVVRALPAGRRVAKLLAMEAHAPCLQLDRRTWKDGRVVTLATLTWPGNRHELAARYATDQYQSRQQ